MRSTSTWTALSLPSAIAMQCNMKALAPSSLRPISSPLFRFSPTGHSHVNNCLNSIQSRRRTIAFAAINDASLTADPTQLEITWQIVVGAIAGVTPFVVAGIEFSKRIIAQRRCRECGGSGLVLRDDDYFRCPECGGFLPWQSWRRFFWG